MFFSTFSKRSLNNFFRYVSVIKIKIRNYENSSNNSRTKCYVKLRVFFCS